MVQIAGDIAVGKNRLGFEKNIFLAISAGNVGENELVHISFQGKFSRRFCG
jgi:hypothetical protein